MQKVMHIFMIQQLINILLKLEYRGIIGNQLAMGYILTNQCMFQVQGNDINNWKTIQYVSGAPDFSSYHGISHVFKRGKYLYAIDAILSIYGKLILSYSGAKKLVTH